MAKKATASGGAGRKAAAKKSGRKAERKAEGKPQRAGKAAKRRPSSDMNAGDALMKLLESPLVADLLAVGATAAVAAIAGHRTNRSGASGGAVKAAGKAAASAIGRRLSTEVEEIRKVSKAKEAGRG